MTRTKAFRDGLDFAFHRARQVLAQLDQKLEAAQEQAFSLPSRTYPHSTCGHLERLRPSARWILEEVLDALQDAEEIGGPEGQDYIDLMVAVAEEATDRANAAVAMMDADAPA